MTREPAAGKAAPRTAGLEQPVLAATAGNTHAVRLYQRAGFTPYGLLPRAIVVAGVGHDKLHMLRLLPSQPIALHEDH
ncbi:GNAT family N-acetyltransferase [Alicycliphilus sp. T452]